MNTRQKESLIKWRMICINEDYAKRVLRLTLDIAIKVIPAKIRKQTKDLFSSLAAYRDTLSNKR